MKLFTIENEGSAAVLTKSHAAAQAGAGLAVFGGLTANEWAAFGGLAVAVVGLLMNFWFKWQHLKIAKSNHQADPDE